MKKSLSFMVLLLFVAQFHAQQYIPLLQEGNQWYEYHEDYTPDGYGPVYEMVVFINGTEEKNGILYKKLFSNIYCTAGDRTFPCNPVTNPDVFYKLVRENIDEKKVYYYDEETNSDVLLYDFSLDAGDHHPENFPFYDNNSPYYDLIISNVVQGHVFDRDVKTFTMYDNNKVNIYEGIGSNTGLLHRPGLPIFEGGNWLICFENVESGKSCNSEFHLLATSESQFNKDLILYYSKSNHTLGVKGDSSHYYTIRFFDAGGRFLETIKAKGNQNFTLESGANGILFYTISDEKTVGKGKIILP
ncbi:MAG: hypothetical protein LBE36_07725 [Flavobacteriaceae bacterium]|jgi:hypothetical protein|nr:hypothetical protein [Flavobacteriaceae bacterium]